MDGRRTTDGRRTDDGRRTTEPAYTISSPGAFGSGELIIQKLHYGICSKVYQFIYTLVCNYMPIMRILAKPFFSRSKRCSYTKCLCPKRRVMQPEIYGIGSKVNQFIYTLVCSYMPNIRILAKVILKIFCSQGCSYTKCLCSKKGNN